MGWGESVASSEFQFTRPRGARRACRPRPGPCTRFNSRAHGGRDVPRSSARSTTCFNSRAHGGRDRTTATPPTGSDGFNSRAHGGRDPGSASRRSSSASFNSRAHGGRDQAPPHLAHRKGVSIHAPTGGATDRRRQRRRPVDVSIHAPTGGATPPPSRSSGSCGFNSRAHGGRDEVAQRARAVLEVSIHAPTGGATNVSSSAHPSRMFQFTRPRGARPVSKGRAFWNWRFNSRAHGGRDGVRASPARKSVVSIHAPTGGATLVSRSLRLRREFQFTRPRGARRRRAGEHHRRRVSIHAPTGGATSTTSSTPSPPSFNSRAHGGRDSSIRYSIIRSEFQFTRPRGARPVRCVHRHFPVLFQFTRPRGARRGHVGDGAEVDLVSIHAPTGGATGPRGSSQTASRFQFTRPRGARRAIVRRGASRTRFNSRAHGGRDARRVLLAALPLVSIHAPTGGATRRCRRRGR